MALELVGCKILYSRRGIEMRTDGMGWDDSEHCITACKGNTDGFWLPALEESAHMEI